jgi:hypothetical protein
VPHDQGLGGDGVAVTLGELESDVAGLRDVVAATPPPVVLVPVQRSRCAPPALRACDIESFIVTFARPCSSRTWVSGK